MKLDNVNRRRALRIEFPFTIHVKGIGKNAISTYTENISERGVRVVIKEKPKTSLIVDLEIYVSEEPVCCQARVVWIKNRQSQDLGKKPFFDVGMEFIKLRTDDKATIRKRVEQLEKTVEK